ncbi:hypothetical protein [uncultured Sphingomonas sp.]|uniref:hypothetical protein n=1 Tax=uncultured Sphingomonas sp. TaxID=158754 RepID=UPI0025F40F80|nr:hypothetical protein [uncultured Sphingomonas sp.]
MDGLGSEADSFNLAAKRMNGQLTITPSRIVAATVPTINDVFVSCENAGQDAVCRVGV